MSDDKPTEIQRAAPYRESIAIIEDRLQLLLDALLQVLPPDAAKRLAEDWMGPAFRHQKGWVAVEDLTPEQRAELDALIDPKSRQ